MVKKILFTALAVLLLVAAAVLAGGWWLLATPEGQRRLLAELARRADVTIEAGQVEGRLLDHLVLSDVTVHWPQGMARCATLRLRWQPLALLHGALAIDELSLAGTQIGWLSAAAPAAEPPGIAWPQVTGWPLRLRIAVDRLQLADVVLQPSEGEAIAIDHFTTRLSWRGGTLTLEELDTRLAGYQIQGGASAGFRRPRLHLDLQLEFPVATAGFDGALLRADLATAATTLLAGPVEVQGFSAGEPDLHLTGKLEVHAERLSLHDFTLSRAGRRETLRGTVELAPLQNTLPWSLQAELADLDLAEEIGTPTALRATLAAAGTRSAYGGTFRLTNAGPAWQEIRLSGQFAGDVGQVALSELHGDWLAGTIAGELTLAWSEGLSLAGTLRGRQLDPAAVNPAWAGRVSFDASGAFTRSQQGRQQARLAAELLDSTLHGLVLTGRIDASLDEDDLRIAALELAGAGFSLRGSGRLHERFDYAVDVTSLAGLLKETRGAVQAQGWLRWRDDTLTGEIEGRGRQLGHDELELDTLHLKARLSGGQPTVTAELAAADIVFQSRRLARAKLRLNGTLPEHAIDLALHWEGGEAHIAAAGGWLDNLWSGSITRLDGLQAGIGPWRLRDTAALEAGEDHVRLAGLELTGKAGEALRLDGEALLATNEAIGRTAWQGRLTIGWVGVDLLRLRPFVPDGLALSGHLRGRAEAVLDPDLRVRMDGETFIDSGRLAWQTEEGELIAALRTARLDWAWREESLSGGVQLTLGEYGEAAGRFALPLPARLPAAMNEQGPLHIALDARVREAGLLTALFPALVTASRGELRLQASARGTWREPDLGGNLRLMGAGAYFPAAGIRLEEVALHGELAGDELRITSFSARSGDGQLTGSGSLRLDNWRPAAFHGRLDGERFAAVHLPEVQLMISPELSIEGTAERLQVRGEIVVPELIVLDREQRGVLRESPDVVISVAEAPQRRPFPLALDIRVQVRLGDRVLVKAGGIDARLAGAVTLRIAGPDEIAANGEIQVAEGIYSTYGTQLRISRGRLLYAGGPVGQPTLDILALRSIGEVSAGVQISGTPRVPVVRLYSVPAMADTDILSYIVLGQPLGAEPGQFSALNAAAGALLSRGQSVALQDQLKRQLGIDVIEIEGSADAAASVVTVGKYLSPKLYLSFGQALFSNASEARLRYSITPKWELESRTTGEKSGVDLYYKIEFE